METWTVLLVIHLFFAVALSMVVLSRMKRVPPASVAWMLSFFLLPVLGPFFYVMVGYRKMKRRVRRKPNPARKLAQVGDTIAAEEVQPLEEFGKLARLSEALSQFPTLGGNRLTFLDEAKASYHAMAEAIRRAKHHVHMEFYIFQPDESGAFFRDLLIEKAKEGVECRLLVDHVGSFRLNDRFLEPLRAAGVEFAFFNTVGINRTWSHFHLRNHRKLLVVDGQYGFIGSQNIGNEYVRWKIRTLEWRDTVAYIEGPAVGQLQTIFAEDWEFTTEKPLDDPKYFSGAKKIGDSCVQTLPSGPGESEAGFEMILMEMIHAAEKRVTLLTPYFIPSRAIVISIGAAVRRGVQVELLVPKKSDSWLVDKVSHSWHHDLLAEGANVYLYTKAFIHGKVVTSDGKIALLGSANMDERSFKVNFECSVLIYDSPFTGEVLGRFDDMMKDAEQLDLENLKNETFLMKVRDGWFRLFSPLM